VSPSGPLASLGPVTGLRYDVVDVFTDRAYAGNPLAVVHGANDLSTAQMQAVAAEFGLSETAFPLPPTTPPHRPAQVTPRPTSAAPAAS